MIASDFLIVGVNFARADTVRMKNGDVYRGKIIKESFNEFLQIVMGDGSEKHLVWNDVQTVERDEVLPEPKVDASPTPSENSSPNPSPSPAEKAVSPIAVAAYEPAPQPSEQFHVELDFTSISFDNIWNQITQDGSTVKTSAHSLITSPEDLTLRVLPGHWMIQGRYYSNIQEPDGSIANNQAYSDLALAFGITKHFYLGLWGSFNRSSVNDSNGSTIVQDYTFGSYARVIVPLSSQVGLELQAALGPDFRVASSTINYTGVAFAATESLFFTVGLAKQVQLLFGADGWERVGVLNVTDTQGAPQDDGYTDNAFRLRAVPFGLRVQF